ncbi:tape measure protein [Vandammella animalimorsus]|uniref:tape measure protein n=1 Tax=Vandammella animalimorsus TaxID=2029117 RepID=UPI0031BB39EF
MATELKTKLTIEAQTSGSEKITQLAGELDDLAQQGGKAAPQFQMLAAELRALAQQKEAVEQFVRLKGESRAYAQAAQEAQAATRAAALALREKQQAAAQAAAAERQAGERLQQQRSYQDELRSAIKALAAEYKAQAKAAKASGESSAQTAQRLADTRAQLAVLRTEYRQAAASVQQLGAAQRDSAQALAVANKAQAEAGRQFDGLRKSARQAQDALDAHSITLQRLRDAMAAAGVSGKDLANQQARIQRDMGRVSERATALAADYKKLAGAAQASGDAQQRSHRKVGEGVQSISRQLAQLRNAYIGLQGAMGLAHSVKGLVETADAVQGLRARIQLATGDGALFEQMWQRVAETAQSTSSSLQATGDLFASLTKAGQDAGLSAAQAAEQSLALVQTINQAVQVSGASASASEAAVRQLIQGLQAGVLRGDEFNSVMEQAPRLARALADGLGVTTGELRKMAEAGQLTAEAVTGALQSQAQTLQQEFGQLPQTVGRAIENLGTAWSLFVDRINESTGASRLLAGAIEALAGNLEAVAAWALRAGAVVAAVFAIKAVQSARDFAAAALSSARALDAVAASGKSASAAISAAADAKQRFASIARGIAYVAIAEQVLRIASAYAELRRQRERQAQAEQQNARLQEQLAQRLREISESTGVLVQSAEEFEAALTSGLIVADEASGEWLSAAQAQERLAQAAQKTTAELTAQTAVDIVGQFDKLTQAGKDAAQALGEIGQAVDWADTTQIDGYIRALYALEAAGRTTAEQTAAAWQAAFAKMSGAQLTQALEGVKRAYAELRIGADQFAQFNEAVLTESFRRLGLSASQAMGSVGQAVQDAMQDMERMAESMRLAGASADQLGQALELAFGQAIAKADSLQALDALQAKLQDMGAAGKIGAEGIARVQAALDKQRAAIEEQLPGIQSLEQALKQLGVTPVRELQELARRAREAFEAVKQSGQATPREINEAWKKMAEAAIEANGGVADAALRAQAAQHGFALQADESGKVVIKAMQGAARATREVGQASREAAKQMQQMQAPAQDVEQAVYNAIERHKEAGKTITSAWLSASAAASQYAQEAARHAHEMVGAMEVPGRVLMSWGQLDQLQAEHLAKLGRVADEYVRAMQAIDAQQQALSRSNSSAAQGVDDLRLRLLELGGTEAEIARERHRRDELRIEREIQLAQLELQRAQLRGDEQAAQRLQQDIAHLREQIQLLDKIHAIEERNRKARAREEARRGGQASGGGAGSGAGGLLPPAPAPAPQLQPAPPVNITLHAHGITDPVRLAKAIEPELARLTRLAR